MSIIYQQTWQFFQLPPPPLDSTWTWWIVLNLCWIAPLSLRFVLDPLSISQTFYVTVKNKDPVSRFPEAQFFPSLFIPSLDVSWFYFYSSSLFFFKVALTTALQPITADGLHSSLPPTPTSSFSSFLSH